MSAPWPNLESISIAMPFAAVHSLEPAQVGILYRLVGFIAGQSVHTYSDPNPDPRLPLDEKRLRNIAFCTGREWKSFRPLLDKFFVRSEDGWRLIDGDMIRLSRPMTRVAISTAVKSVVLARDGQRCAYCGDIEGPFHFDHLYPVSRGGSNEAHNIVLACAPCNLAKGGLTLAEWVGR